MAKHPQTLFTLSMLHDCFDAIWGTDEPEWLAPMLSQKYSTYRLPHRQGYLRLVLDGTAHLEPDEHKKAMMVARAIGKLKTPFESLNDQQKKQLAQNYRFKLRTLAVRTVFLASQVTVSSEEV